MSVDVFTNISEFSRDLQICITKFGKAHSFKISGTLFIVCLLFLFKVPGPVKLNYKSRFCTIKINYISANRLLPLKTQGSCAKIAKPKHPLILCHVLPELARKLYVAFSIRFHSIDLVPSIE